MPDLFLTLAYDVGALEAIGGAAGVITTVGAAVKAAWIYWTNREKEKTKGGCAAHAH